MRRDDAIIQNDLPGLIALIEPLVPPEDEV
jgi:hypothetical protein